MKSVKNFSPQNEAIQQFTMYYQWGIHKFTIRKQLSTFI